MCVHIYFCCIKERNELNKRLFAWIKPSKKALRKKKMVLICPSAVRKLGHGHETDLLQVMMLI